MSKMWNEDGSITVEMSLIFPIIFFILWLVLYLIMYVVDIGNINYAIGTALMENYLYVERESNIEPPKVLSIGEIQFSTKSNQEQTAITATGRMQIPFLSIHNLLGNVSYDFKKMGTIEYEHPIKVIRRRKMFEKELDERGIR